MLYIIKNLSAKYRLSWCSGLQKYLNQQGFNIGFFGCITCIGNTGDLDESVAAAITEYGKGQSRISITSA